jgi:hypothetical protein
LTCCTFLQFKHFNTFRPLFQQLLEINVKFKLQTCSVCQDLPTMQFWSISRNPFWSYFLQNCMVDRSWHVEHVCCLNLTFISNSFWNKGRKVLKCWKFDEKREITPKIYLPCNLEVNSITYFGVITLFSSNFQHFNTFRPLFQKLLEINVKFKLQTCSACQDLPTMQFEKREITPKWVTGFTSKLHGRQILTCYTFLQFKLNIYLL